MMEKKIIIFITLILIILVPLRAIAARYVNNGDGTVTDNVTGLMWQKEDNNTTYTWEPAIIYCEGLSFATYSDWRLPDIKELRSIVDNSRYDPSIDATYFPNTNPSGYWSSTTSAYDSDYAWGAYFNVGNVNYFLKGNSFSVRCVRGGQ